MHVLMLGQQTAAMSQYIPSGECVRASSPAFNVRGESGWAALTVEPYDASVFGVSITHAINDLLETKIVSETCREMGIRIPRYEFDVYVQKNVSKVTSLVGACRSRGLMHSADHIERFVHAVSNLLPQHIQSMADWEQFLSEQNIAKDWKGRIHQDKVGGLFGLNEENIRSLGKTYEFKWLSRCLNLWVVKGCKTDIVNTICAILNTGNPKGLTESQLVILIKKFTHILTHPEFITGNTSWMWIPSTVIHDAESDDCISWVLCIILNRIQGTPMKTIVQLPCHSDLNVVARFFGQHKDVFVVRDPHSKNAKALRDYWLNQFIAQ